MCVLVFCLSGTVLLCYVAASVVLSAYKATECASDVYLVSLVRTYCAV